MILELGPGADILRAIGVAYWLLAAGAIILVWWLGKRWWIKIPLTVAILALSIHPVYKQDQKNRETIAASNARYETAKKMFEERCKTAGEKIYRTVEGVEGIFLMKIRPEKDNLSRQFDLDDPYGRDLGGEAFIRSFLKGGDGMKRPPNPRPGWPRRIGYSYVEAVDAQDGVRYRYTGAVKAVGRMDESSPNVRAALIRDPNFDLNIYRFSTDRRPSTGPLPRYGITFADISTQEDREYWIAGSSLKIVDLMTKETVAERIGYMMDPGQGSQSGGRSPWLFAANNACPDFHRFPNPIVTVPGSSAQILQTEDFAEKVLIPKASS